MEHEEIAVTHKQIWDKISESEEMVRRWFLKAAAIMIPLVLSGFIWTWNSYANQQAFNADINARMLGNTNSYNEARAAQQRIEQRLDEIQRFLREDSREIRETIKDHAASHGHK